MRNLFLVALGVGWLFFIGSALAAPKQEFPESARVFIQKHEPEIRKHAAEAAHRIKLRREKLGGKKFSRQEIAELRSRYSHLYEDVESPDAWIEFFTREYHETLDQLGEFIGERKNEDKGAYVDRKAKFLTGWMGGNGALFSLGFLATKSLEHSGHSSAAAIVFTIAATGLASLLYTPPVYSVYRDSLRERLQTHLIEVVYDEFQRQGLELADIAADEKLYAALTKAKLRMQLIDDPALLAAQIRQLSALIAEAVSKLEGYPARQEALRALAKKLPQGGKLARRWWQGHEWIDENFKTYVETAGEFRGLLKTFELAKTGFDVGAAVRLIELGANAMVGEQESPLSFKDLRKGNEEIDQLLSDITAKSRAIVAAQAQARAAFDPQSEWATALLGSRPDLAVELLGPQLRDLLAVSGKPLQLRIDAEQIRVLKGVDSNLNVVRFSVNVASDFGFEKTFEEHILTLKETPTDAILSDSSWTKLLGDQIEQKLGSNGAFQNMISERMRAKACELVVTDADVKTMDQAGEVLELRVTDGTRLRVEVK